MMVMHRFPRLECSLKINYEQASSSRHRLIMFGLDELSEVLPPPANPRVTTTQAGWIEVFACIGTRLPGDFIAAYKAYGNGSFISRSHPTSGNLWLYGGDL